MRLALVGDVGGHLVALSEALLGLGVDLDSRLLPDDLVVCQVGDLVHRGPDSPGVLALVDELMDHNPGRWVQLAGNHEAQYLFPPVFQWPEVLPDPEVALLRRWWDSGRMVLAAAFETAGVPVRLPGGSRAVVGAGPLLVTHAGLTPGLWRHLGAPTSALDAAAAVNSLRHDPSSPVWAPGRMLGEPSSSAGVVWAEASSELYDGWYRLGRSPGFHQAHGHSSALWWNRGRWNSPVDAWRTSAPDGAQVSADPQAKVVRAEVWGQVLWGVDPGHGVDPQTVWSPLVLPAR